METIEARYIAIAATLIALAAAVVVAYHTIWALWLIGCRRPSDAARLVIARGVLAALAFMVAATLMNTVALQTWTQIRMFAFVLLLRTLLKWVFEREQTMISKRASGS